MKVAFVSPLPPVRSGIAHYSAQLLPALAERFDVVAVVDQEAVDPQQVPVIPAAEYERRAGEFDAVICQLGNNRHHEYAWKVANRGGAIVVLHDVVMHHLLVELTIAQGDAESLDAALSAIYGEAGRAIAAARARGIHDDLPNFLYPASEGVARGARHVLVHNRWAADRLRAGGVTAPVTVAPLAYELPEPPGDEVRASARSELGFLPRHRVVGVFGFVTHAKRPAQVMRAFARALPTNDDLRLLFVGEPAHNVDLDSLAAGAGVPEGRWTKTGFVSDDDFDRYLAAVDRIVNLRYPSAGETSGPLMRAFAVGRPVAVSDYAQFSDYPSTIVTRIPFDDEERAVEQFMLADVDLPAIAGEQRAWLRATNRMDLTVEAYARAVETTARLASSSPVLATALPLFPRLSASIESAARAGREVAFTMLLTNEGGDTIPAALYGQPPFVVFARCVAPDATSRSFPALLTGDLGSGRSARLAVRVECDATRFTLELRCGLGGVPDIDRPPFFSAEVRA